MAEAKGGKTKAAPENDAEVITRLDLRVGKIVSAEKVSFVDTLVLLYHFVPAVNKQSSRKETN